MLVLVPLVIVAISGGVRNEPFFPRSLAWVPLVAGGLFLIVGLRLMVRTIRLFASSGKGTLAPWDPPGQLVVAGPYRHVRNPMISGVLSVLLAESLLLESSGVAIWLAVFFLVSAIVIPLFEEPGLVRRERHADVLAVGHDGPPCRFAAVLHCRTR